jgi:hypothetical protein
MNQMRTASGRVLLFEFKNMNDRLSLNLIIGPGPSEVRQRLFNLAQNARSVFKPASRNLTPTWATIWSRQLITSKEYSDLELMTALEKLTEGWQRFVQNDLPKLEDAIKGVMSAA